jgi:hypothetical protein
MTISRKGEAASANDLSWLPELIVARRLRFDEFGIAATQAVGDFGDLPARLEFGRKNARSYALPVGLVGV